MQEDVMDGFDITKQDAIFEHLKADGKFQFLKGHKIPSADEIADRNYCKWHNSWTHSTKNCLDFWLFYSRNSGRSLGALSLSL